MSFAGVAVRSAGSPGGGFSGGAELGEELQQRGVNGSACVQKVACGPPVEDTGRGVGIDARVRRSRGRRCARYPAHRADTCARM